MLTYHFEKCEKEKWRSDIKKFTEKIEPSDNLPSGKY